MIKLTIAGLGIPYYYQTDALGSIVALTDSSGNVVERYNYDVYGRPTIYNAAMTQTYSSSQYGNRFMFTGREYDAETGLYYYRARYYNPTMGRFMQMDPLGVVPNAQKPNKFAVLGQYKDGMSLYEYVKSNPVNYTDSYGFLSVQVCVRPLSKFSGWLPWWGSPANHAYIQINDWSAGFQFDDTVHIPEDDPNHSGHTCWPGKRVKTGNLPNGKPCKCATDGEIESCIKSYAQKGATKGGYPEYDFFTNNCGTWVIKALKTCCLRGRVPIHYYPN